MDNAKENRNDFSKVILNLSISLLLAVISTFAIIGALNVQRFTQFAAVNIREVMEYHKTAYESSIKSQNNLKDSVANFLNAYSSVLSDKEGLNKSIRSNELCKTSIAEEILINFLALLLGDQNYLSPAEVNSIFNTTLDKISNKSERWSKVAKAANKMFLDKLYDSEYYNIPQEPVNTSFDAIGKTAPDFEFTQLDGTLVKLSDMKGEIVILEFWLTSDPLCRQMIPELKKIYSEYENEGVEILAVSLDEAETQVVKNFVEDSNINYPVFIWSSEVIEKIAQREAVPVLLIIDREGIIRFKYIGFKPAEDIEKALKEVLFE